MQVLFSPSNGITPSASNAEVAQTHRNQVVGGNDKQHRVSHQLGMSEVAPRLSRPIRRVAGEFQI
jgi:hypothetical protein